MIARGSVNSDQEIVYVRYLDHVLFRNADHSLYKPAIRECVGWILKESGDAVWILWDRSVCRLLYERTLPIESGLVIVKSDILEMRKLG